MDETWIKIKLAQHPCKELPTGNLRTCPVRLSFPHLFKPSAMPDQDGKPGKLKYSAGLLFPRGAAINLLVDACRKTANEAFGSKWFASLPNGKVLGTQEKGAKQLSFPFRDQSEKVQWEGFEEGCYWFNATSDNKPGVIDQRGKAITDETAIYGGVWALVTLRPFAYDVDMKKGVSLGLQNVQKMADDEPFGGGRPSAEEEFDVLDDGDNGSSAASKEDALEAYL